MRITCETTTTSTHPGDREVWVTRTPHEVKDRAKVAALAESLKADGWQGRPLLVLRDEGDDIALTGTHRWAALRAINDEAERTGEGSPVEARVLLVEIDAEGDAALRDLIYRLCNECRDDTDLLATAEEIAAILGESARPLVDAIDAEIDAWQPA